MSAKTFGPRFNPDDFKGPLAGYYCKREDKFQQLVGALLREKYKHRAKITSTEGRDGAIDGFVETGEDTNEKFCDLPFPLIMESKDHDDSLGKVAHNVMIGWSNVEKKLKKHAAAGWKGDYSPWTGAKGYLYCVSAVLNQATRVDLIESIKDFFDKLPPKQKPPIEKIHVLDWSDLASLLNEHTRIADLWLGIGHTGILNHSAYEQSLDGFKRYLKEDELPFVYSEEEDQANPANLLNALKKTDSIPGILLVGAGGVGKTRTCFEVARLADNEGWHVLHILHGEPPVTALDIQDIVLQGNTRTLIVIDYLDKMESLDINSIRNRLNPELKKRNIHLAILANARPLLLRKTDLKQRYEFFKKIDLDIESRSPKIVLKIIEKITPEASGILGVEKVKDLCGKRPIIAMFIACELERYARAGTLNRDVVSQLRNGELSDWIIKRFREDGLFPIDTDPLQAAQPNQSMIAAAAMLAAAPLFDYEISFVARATLEATGIEKSKVVERSEGLMTSLQRSGWLERPVSLITTPHDVISDKLLELTLCDLDLKIVRHAVMEQVFISALTMPRTLGHFSVSLDRVIGPKDFNDEMSQKLRTTVSDWLCSNASAIGKSFSTANPDEVSYALGAVIAGSALSEAALRSWDNLITPWLNSNDIRLEARHLLYRGLKELPEGQANNIIKSSNFWLKKHLISMDAGFVLAPLLGRKDLTRDQAIDTVAAAVSWLNDHRAESVAQFVLDPLLGRKDLTLDQAIDAVAAAVSWLNDHRAESDAGFVLGPLLGRKDLTRDQAIDTVAAAVDWLKDHRAESDAGFVLGPLLGREDLTLDQAIDAVAAAVDWLKDHRAESDAQFVLGPLLGREDLTLDQAIDAVAAAVDWLKDHRAESDAKFVLAPLLERKDLTLDQAIDAIATAMDWLESHSQSEGADFILNNILKNDYKNNMCRTKKRRVFTLTLNQIEKLNNTPEASFIIRSCLNDKTLTDAQWKNVSECVIRWLHVHKDSGQIDFVFKPLLRNKKLDNRMWREVANFAINWLKITTLGPDRDFTLNSLLRRSYLLTQEEQTFIRTEFSKFNSQYPKPRLI